MSREAGSLWENVAGIERTISEVQRRVQSFVDHTDINYRNSPVFQASENLSICLERLAVSAMYLRQAQAGVTTTARTQESTERNQNDVYGTERGRGGRELRE
jgi:hypothetical protein